MIRILVTILQWAAPMALLLYELAILAGINSCARGARILFFGALIAAGVAGVASIVVALEWLMTCPW